jgi:hypothetical protein
MSEEALQGKIADIDSKIKDAHKELLEVQIEDLQQDYFKESYKADLESAVTLLRKVRELLH